MASLRRKEGYYVVDLSNSPGAFGIPGGTVYESATIMCSHCQVTVRLNPKRTRPRNYCAKCDHYICDNPICNADCLPMVKVLDTLQNAAAVGDMETFTKVHDLFHSARQG